MTEIEISLVAGNQDDADDVVALYARASGRELDAERYREFMSSYPAVIGRTDSGQLVCFAFGTRFGPDVIELSNIYVAPEYRSSGLGTRLLRAWEDRVFSGPWRAVVLVNSMLYENADGKRDASAFYMRNGYRLLLSTGPSNIWGKALAPETAPDARRTA